MSPLRKPLILRTVPSSAFTLLEIRTYIEQNVNANSRIYGRVIRKSDKMKGVFDIGTFRSGLIDRFFDNYKIEDYLEIVNQMKDWNKVREYIAD